MPPTSEPKGLKDLIRLLGGLQRMHEQLLELIRDKMDAIRRADIAALRRLAQQEQTVAGRLQAREGLRRQLMDMIGRDMGLSTSAARAMTVSQIASRVPQASRDGLLDVARGLRDVIARVAQANRVAGAVSREILGHLAWVFSSVRPVGEKAVGYSGRGGTVGPAGTRIFETVG